MGEGSREGTRGYPYFCLARIEGMEKEMDLLLLLLWLIILLNTICTVIAIITTSEILGICYIAEDGHGLPGLHSFLTNTGQVSA